MYTQADLIRQIREMDIQQTDTVLIHTSMRAIGEVENGADGVIDAFRTVLGEGLLLVPTHTWSNVNREQPVYDVASTVPCIGALPRVAAFRKDGVRSLHPTHSIWAAGKGAADFIANEENAPTPGAPGFAWNRLAEVGAKILLLGVGLDRNTFIHAVEEIADVPDRLDPEPYEVVIRDGCGREIRHPFRRTPLQPIRRCFPTIRKFRKTFARSGSDALRSAGQRDRAHCGCAQMPRRDSENPEKC